MYQMEKPCKIKGEKMNKRITKLVSFLSLGIILFIVIQAQPAYGFVPTNIRIIPNPQNIPCGGAGVVTVTITGPIALADQQANYFHVRLVDGDPVTDDIMGDAKVTPMTDGKGPFIRGQVRTFTLTFDIQCDGCTITGDESSGETEAELAVETDAGRVKDKTNHFDSVANDYVPVRCVKDVVSAPALTPFGLMALIGILTLLASWTIKRK